MLITSERIGPSIHERHFAISDATASGMPVKRTPPWGIRAGFSHTYRVLRREIGGGRAKASDDRIRWRAGA
jgi:hypothetical protein